MIPLEGGRCHPAAFAKSATIQVPRKRMSTMSTRADNVATAAALIACIAVLSCEAAYQPASPIESGWPRDLINQPICGNPDNFGDWRHCELSQDTYPCAPAFCAA
jgi:hypothetical protein